jgi:hypothetical protein
VAAANSICSKPEDPPGTYKPQRPDTSGKKQYKKAGFTDFNYNIELKDWSADVDFGTCTDLDTAADCAATRNSPQNQLVYWWVKNVKSASATGKKSFKYTDFYGTVSGSKEIKGFDSDIASVYDYKGEYDSTLGYHINNPLSQFLSPIGSRFAEYKCKFSYGGKNTLSVGGAIGICVAVAAVLSVVTALILYFVCIKASKNPVQSP